jgi:serine/threonine protein kinase
MAGFMQKWASRDEGREESAKWDLVSDVLRKGVRFPPISSLMPLYRSEDSVFLSVRTEAHLYPLYRYMHGNLVAFGMYYDATVGDVLDMTRAVLECCSMLQVFGGIHHCDIKPENVLFRVRAVRAKSAPPAADTHEERSAHGTLSALVANRSKKLEFVLSDFGSAVSHPSMDDLRNVRGTGGYLCPLVHDTFPEFNEEFDRLFRKYATLPHSKFTAASVWASYAVQHAERSAGTLDNDAAMAKNDMYALGATILNFAFPPKLDYLAKFAATLMVGGPGSIWKIGVAQAALDRVHRKALASHSMLELVEFKRTNNDRLRPGAMPNHAAPKAVFKKYFSNTASTAAAKT